MLRSLLKKIRRIVPGQILTVLFLLYIASIGFSSFPNLLRETVKQVQRGSNCLEIIESVNEYYDDFLPSNKNAKALLNKGTYINLNGLMAKSLGQPMLNKRIKLNNGHLTSLTETAPHEETLRAAADNLIHFFQKHRENGGNFLFVMAPGKISKYERVLPPGYTDVSNETADRFLALLSEGGIPVLDLRETLMDSGIPWDDAFFATDHHWTPQTGFLSFREIVRTLAETGATEAVDPFYTDENNFTFHTYPNTFLGSDGKRTGIYFAGMDDSIFITPDFPTDIHLTIPELDVDLLGPYQEISYHQESGMDLQNPDPFNDNMYGLYGWGDTAISHWRNDAAPVSQRLLLIGDSFGNIPFSLMSLCYSSCDEMDMRYFSEDFEDYYHDYRPQTVVILINPNHCDSEFTCKTFLN